MAKRLGHPYSNYAEYEEAGERESYGFESAAAKRRGEPFMSYQEWCDHGWEAYKARGWKMPEMTKPNT